MLALHLTIGQAGYQTPSIARQARTMYTPVHYVACYRRSDGGKRLGRYFSFVHQYLNYSVSYVEG